MEKYTLNETSVRTANNFGINNIELEMELPVVKRFDNAMIITYEMDKIQIGNIGIDVLNSKQTSKIGLSLNQNYTLTLTVPKGEKLKEPVILDFNFDEDNTVLIDNIKIQLENNAEADFILKYSSEENNKYFHYLKLETIAEENSKSKIIIANMLDNDAESFIAIENTQQEQSKVNYILAELSGKTKISNYFSKLEGNYAENNVKSIYLGTNNDVIDINYNIEVYGKYTKCNINTQGAISGNAHKNFKGIIDFKQGAENSKGIENENCMILSDTAISKSLPVLLCKEENVEGEHGVSSGKIDEAKLFYIMTKGISYDDARKLIVKANFSKILKEIKNEELQNEIISIIDEKL